MPSPRTGGKLNWGALAQASPRLTSLTPAPGPCPTHSFLKEGSWKGISDSSVIMWCLGRGLAHSRTNGVSRQGSKYSFSKEKGSNGTGTAGDPPAWVALLSAGSGSGFDLHPFPPLTSTCSGSPWGLGKVRFISRKFFRVKFKVKLICM